MAASRSLGALNRNELGVARFSGRPPWEKHAEDELIYVVDGAVEITLWKDAQPEVFALASGSLVVIPAETWHRSFAEDFVTLLFATPSEGNQSSFADDPRS